MNKDTLFCPFKKTVTVDYNPTTGKKEISERFAPCAGKRCMAYADRGFFTECLRMPGPDVFFNSK